MTPVEELDHPQRLAHDFRPDAVAREHEHLAVGRAGLRHGSGPGPDHAELPGTRKARLFLIGADFRALLLGQADVVEPIQETMLAKCIELERYLLAVRPRDRLSCQID